MMKMAKEEIGTFWSRPLLSGAVGLTPRTLIISSIALVIWSWTANFSMDLSGVNQYEVVLFPLFLLLGIEYIFIRAGMKRLSLSPQEWAVFMVFTSTMLVSNCSVSWWWPAIQWVWERPEYASLIPDFWAPKDRSILERAYSGGPLDWGPWIMPMVFWMVMCFTLWVGGTFFLLPLRKVWVDEEKLPFPWVVRDYESIKFAKGLNRPSVWNVRKVPWFWIGIFLGFLQFLPDWIVYVGVPIPPTITFGWTPIDLRPYFGAYLPGAQLVPTHTSFPIAYWGAYWVPMDIAATGTLVYLLLGVLWPPITYYLGLWTPAMGDPGYTGPIKYNTMFYSTDPCGIMIAIATWPLIMNWRRYKDTLVAFVKGGPREEGEAFSWRTSWGLFFGTLILYLILMMYSGAPIIGALISYVATMFYVIVWGRIMAEVGFWGPNTSRARCVVADIGATFGAWPRMGVSDAAVKGMFPYAAFGHYQDGCGLSPIYSIQQFAIGRETETPARTIGISYLIAALISIVVGVPMSLYFIHWFGFERILNNWWWYGTPSGNSVNTIEIALTRTTEIDYGGSNPYPWIVAGAIITYLIYFLRLRFPGFWFNPLGLAVGLYAGFCMTFVIEPFIIKWLVLRFGGTRAYESGFVPAVVGMSIGFIMTGWVLTLVRAVSVLGTL
jgi:hypothetical protein